MTQSCTILIEEREMENNLGRCKKGEWIATTVGWKQVKRIHNYAHTYPINIDDRLYTLDGKLHACDIVPSAFVDPPDWLLEYIGPKPCEFRKDELVIVWDEDTEKCPTFLEYFCRTEGNNYLCYQHGRTSATSQGKVNAWTHCRKAIKGEDY